MAQCADPGCGSHRSHLLASGEAMPAKAGCWEHARAHAPTPLAANGLDMRVGHPAARWRIHFISHEVLTPRRHASMARLQLIAGRPRRKPGSAGQGDL